jgi:hypothetical protein
MEIIFTNHAKCRIQERKIKFSDVKSVVVGQSKIAKMFDDKVVAKKVFENYELEVVYKKNRNKIIVITAYYL